MFGLGTLKHLMRCYLRFAWNFGKNVRLAHAFRSFPTARDVDDLAEVIGILQGNYVLRPRPPADPTAVSEAETLLKLTTSPIYTFAGCLHPDLGTIGLVIHPGCIPRCLQGVSRCDSGGLAAGRGAFANLPRGDAAAALTSLTCNNGNWLREFSDELAMSYSTVRDYISGTLPKHDSWQDARSFCITAYLAASATKPDRRLWTWEVRLSDAPIPAEYEGVVLSPEAFKKLDFLHRSGAKIPPHVTVIRGAVGPLGVHHFNDVQTVVALSGRRSPR